MATNVTIKEVNGQKILNVSSIKFENKHHRQAQISGNMYGVKLPSYLEDDYPFEELVEFSTEGLGEDKNENRYVRLVFRLNSGIQAEVKKCFGGTIDGVEWAKPPGFDSYKNDASCYSIGVFVNRPDEAYPYNISNADAVLTFGNWLSSSSDDISNVYFEGEFSNRLNEEFARFTVTPALMIDRVHFWDGGRMRTMTVRMNTEYKSGTYTSNDSSIYFNGRGNGTIRVYNNSGSLLHEVYLDNDNFSIGSAAPYTYGIDLSVNGSNICYYQKNNYQIYFDVEYWNTNTGAYLEY